MKVAHLESVSNQEVEACMLRPLLATALTPANMTHQGVKSLPTIEEFEALDVRVGTVIEALPFPQARKPAYKLRIDFGPDLGVKRSSAQITQKYTPETLIGRQVMAVVNFPPRQIGQFISDVLTLGVADHDGAIILVVPEKSVPNGGKIF